MTNPAAARTTTEGRVYPVVNPETGEIVDLPSVTTVIKTKANPGLRIWELKRLAYTIATNPDLAATAATAEDDRDKRLWGVVQAANGRQSSAADIGTAIHELTERADVGKLDISKLPNDIADTMRLYEALRAEYGWETLESEVTVVNFTVGYAGTADRFISFDGLTAADVKTGKVHDSVALQLAGIVNAEYLLLPVGDDEFELKPMPDLRKDIGHVIHLPYHGDKARLVEISLDGAWPAFRGLVAAQQWEMGPAKFAVKGEVERPRPAPSSGGSKVSPRPSTPYGEDLPVESGGLENVGRHPRISTTSTGDPIPSDDVTQTGGQVPQSSDGVLVELRRERRDWLTGRIERLRNEYPEALRALTFAWPDGVPTLKKADDHDDEQLDAINAALWQVERDHQVPFPDDDQVIEGLRQAFDVEEHERRLAFAPSWQKLVKAEPGLADVVPEHLRWTDSIRLALVDAVEAGDIAGVYDSAGDSVNVRPSILDDLVERYGSKGNVLKAARGLSKFGFKFPVPRSAAGIAEDPLCVALLLHYKHPKKRNKQ